MSTKDCQEESTRKGRSVGDVRERDCVFQGSKVAEFTVCLERSKEGEEGESSEGTGKGQIRWTLRPKLHSEFVC